MESGRKSADSFGTFLEIVQGKAPAGQPADPAIRLLTTLDASGPLHVSELLSKTGLDLGSFVDALKTVKEGGFVTSQAGADGELVQITESGTRVAALGRGGS